MSRMTGSKVASVVAVRYTRLAKALPKKFENHIHMVAPCTVWYNYVRRHKSLKGLSRAMAAGPGTTLREMKDLTEMIDATLPKPGPRGLQETGDRMRTYHLREGQIVRVLDGPFAGFRGEVKEVDEESSTVKVALQVYGRVTPMDVAPEQIERVAQNSK
jgi:transcription antitermination factor NusG